MTTCILYKEIPNYPYMPFFLYDVKHRKIATSKKNRKHLKNIVSQGKINSKNGNILKNLQKNEESKKCSIKFSPENEKNNKFIYQL